MVKTAYEKIFGVCSEPKSATSPFLLQANLHQLGHKDAVTCGESHATCSSRIAKSSRTASDIHVERLKHQEVAQEGKLLFPCADGSFKLFDLPQLPLGEMSPHEEP